MAAVRSGDIPQARAVIAALVEEEFGFSVQVVTIGVDGYSLNSVNGFIDSAQKGTSFFKFHHEENEETVLEEFYRGEILRDAGYPIDMPVYVSRRPGRQILLYRKRDTPKFADVARAVDAGGASDPLRGVAIAAQEELDTLTSSIYRDSWHAVTDAESAGEPIHQLFYHRLTDANGAPDKPGGRAARFFRGDRVFNLPGATLSGSDLCGLRWRIDGVDYDRTIAACFHTSLRALAPAHLARSGGVVAHGGAHNANVWFGADAEQAHLCFFDPAFAGRHVPALLAEIKATFHNIFAHADWLYHPDVLAAKPVMRVENQTAIVETGWSLTPLRRSFLQGKAKRLWRPLLGELHERGALPENWRETIRCGLFCCPTLVLDLCPGAGRHTPHSALLGLSIAVMCGAEPQAHGADPVARFLDAIDPLLTQPDFETI
nr:hypothetical protein [Acetobacter oeni]